MYAPLLITVFQSKKISNELNLRITLHKNSPYSELFWSAGKIRTRITPNTDSFYAVLVDMLIT